MTATAATEALDRFPLGKVSAIVAWLVGTFFTVLFVKQLGASTFLAIIIAAILQLIFTKAERPIWRLLLRRGGSAPLLGLALFLVDAGMNAAGIYQHIPKILNTDLAKMLIVGFNLSTEISLGGSIFLAFIIGAIAAGLPEYLWEAE